LDRAKALELLKECLNEIQDLKGLHHANQEYKLWEDKVLDIIKAGLDADDVNKFLRGQKMYVDFSWIAVTSEKAEQKHYLERLTNYETNLKSIIQKYEMLGPDIEETSMMKLGISAAEEINRLFDGMHFHHRVIVTSESLFKDGHYAQAIFEAFKAVNNFVKQETGLSNSDGKELMARVFKEDDPIIELNELKTRSEQDEQEGFKFLFMGAMVGIRNPKAHDNVVQAAPHRTLEYLGFASLLMERIEEGRITQSKEINV